ncbi:U3 small nucleolar ribonucleoprotein complex, subunit Mpp10 [Amanita muscaria]
MEDPASLPSELLQLSHILQHKVESIATGSQDIRHAALLATQYLFNQALQSEPEAISSINQLVSSLDPLEAPQTRSKTNGKRKRSPSPRRAAKPVFRTTPLTGLFVDGMSEDQIWAQLDIRTKNMCDILHLVIEDDPLESGDENENEEDEDEDEDSLLDNTMPVLGEEEEWSGEEDDSEDEEDEAGTESGEEEQAETIAELHYLSSEEDDEQTSRKITLKLPKKRVKSSGLSELDDGFFDLADFNAETEAAEAMSSTRGRLDGADEEASDDEEQLDYFAPVDQSQSAEDEDTHELYYKDFFVPPKRQQSSKTPASPKPIGKVRFHEEVRVKKIKAKGKGQPVSTLYEEEDDFEYDFGELDDAEDEYGESDDYSNESEAGDRVSGLSSADSSSDDGNGRETIDRFKDDLFAEEEEGAQEDMTMHEKRMATLSNQIAELEAENVAPKEWALMGEANSRSRPQNSLLEEDLEFERVMKPVPVVTEETVHALEDRIKNRVLEGRFDDVIRIRPHEEKPFLPSRLIELKDTKSAQSLAQIYEDEYVEAQTGEVVGEDRDGRLRKEHEDIEKLWESICHKLDALSNAHFTPKQPKAVISTVSNVPVTTLESALPTTKSATSMMAPEEIHAPVTSELRARSEMTPSEKKALHNKRKKAKRKTRDLLEKSVDKFAKMKNAKKQKQAALESVVKVGKGVTVVGKQNKDLLKKRRKT